MPHELADELEAYLDAENLDRSTAVRKLLSEGLEEGAECARNHLGGLEPSIRSVQSLLLYIITRLSSPRPMDIPHVTSCEIIFLG